MTIAAIAIAQNNTMQPACMVHASKVTLVARSIFGRSQSQSESTEYIIALDDFLCGSGHPLKVIFLLLQSSERLLQCLILFAHVHIIQLSHS